MDGKRLYALACYDEPSQARLETCRSALVRSGYIGEQTPNIPHHITLASFEAEKEAAVRETVRRLTAKTAPIDLRILSIGLFGLRVLFLSPAPNERLTELAHALAPDPGWVPHTTMFIDQRERVLQALPLLADTFVPFPARVSRIELYEFFPARHIASFPFAESADCR